MDDCEWNSEIRVDSDALSALPPLVIWTSRRSTACPPPPNIAASYGASYGAHHHANAESGNQVATFEFSYAYNAPQRSSFSSWNTSISTSGALQDHFLMENVADKFWEQLPEFQRNKDTNATEVSTTAVENPCSNPMTPALDTDKRSQDNSNQTDNPLSVSDHLTGHGHVAYDSEGGYCSSKSANVDVHTIRRLPESPQPSSISDDPRHHDRQTLNNIPTSGWFSEEDCQLQTDLVQPETSLGKETDKSLDCQDDALDRAHSYPGGNPLQCKHCYELFSTQSRLTSHGCAHPEEKSLKCKVCDKTFSTRSNLTSHGRFHSGKKPFTCKYYAKSFSDKSNHTVHERIHTGDKPFKCDHCDERFTQNQSLRVHERTHTGEKPFQCKLCGKAFTQTSHLRDHEHIHTGEKQFKCKVCNKAFIKKLNLTRHQRIHSGEKPFLCKECGKSFSWKSSLTAHARIHH